MKKSILPFLMLTRNQRIGLLVFGLLLLLTEGLLAFNFSKKTSPQDLDSYDRLAKLETLFDSLNRVQNSGYTAKVKTIRNANSELKPFNPNDLSQLGWVNLGFSPKQAEVILRYKSMIGGVFTSKEQIRKCFVISEEKYAELEPFILLPLKSKIDERLAKQQTKKPVHYTKFNPNHYTDKDWIKIGFSPKQAETILKYKRMVGGEFVSKEQLAKCYVISQEKFDEMKSFIDLPERAESVVKPKNEKTIVSNEKQSVNEKPDIVYEKFNPSTLDKEGWMKLGFSEKQATTIIKYRYSLGGKFTAETLKKSYVISEKKYAEMEPYLVFE